MNVGPILTKSGEVEPPRLWYDAWCDGPSRSGSHGITLSPLCDATRAATL